MQLRNSYRMAAWNTAELVRLFEARVDVPRVVGFECGCTSSDRYSYMANDETMYVIHGETT